MDATNATEEAQIHAVMDQTTAAAANKFEIN
jgi:hypothetical protein